MIGVLQSQLTLLVLRDIMAIGQNIIFIRKLEVNKMEKILDDIFKGELNYDRQEREKALTM